MGVCKASDGWLDKRGMRGGEGSRACSAETAGGISQTPNRVCWEEGPLGKPTAQLGAQRNPADRRAGPRGGSDLLLELSGADARGRVICLKTTAAPGAVAAVRVGPDSVEPPRRRGRCYK